MSGRDADSLQVVDFLRKEVDKKQEQIITLKRTLENQRRQLEAEWKSKEGSYQQSAKDLEQIIARKESYIKRLFGLVAVFGVLHFVKLRF